VFGLRNHHLSKAMAYDSAKRRISTTLLERITVADCDDLTLSEAISRSAHSV